MTDRAPRLFYFCYRHNKPRGGQKRTYRDVDILNANGFSAVVFHPGENFRLTWFENQTPVIGYSEFLRTVDPLCDFVVLPEDLGEAIAEFPGRKVIFNKNVFKGFECFGAAVIRQYPYLVPEVVAVLTVSEHNREQLQFAYPHLHIDKVDEEINPNTFSFCPLKMKRPVIACAMKSREMLLPVYHMIQSRAAAGLNRGKEFQWIFMQDLSEKETAGALHDALLFLFMSVAEGLGRMPLEAMASGCILVAYGHGPLADFLPDPNRFHYGDPANVVRFIEAVMQAYPDGCEQWTAAVESGLELVRRYSLANQEAQLVDAWRRILDLADHFSKRDAMIGKQVPARRMVSEDCRTNGMDHES